MTTSVSRRAALAVEPLEARAVPANNLNIEDVLFDDSDFVRIKQAGATVTIETTAPDAHLSLKTIQDALTDPTVTEVIVSTDVANGQGANNGNQAGNITWNGSVVGSLDFTGFGTGKSLTFQTVDEGASVGNITLSSVSFSNPGTDDRISLTFDTADPGGDVTFQSAGGMFPTVQFNAAAVADLTVAAGTGDFTYSAGGFFPLAEVSGAVTITAGPVDLGIPGGVTAGGPISVTAGGPVLVTSGAGFSAVGDLTISATGTVNMDAVSLTADGGRVAVSGTDVALNNATAVADDGFTITGTTAVDFDFGNYAVAGNVSITGGTIDLQGVSFPASGVGAVTMTGTTVTLANSFLVGGGPAAVTGTALTLNNVTLGGDTLTATGPLSLAPGTGVDLRAAGNMSLPGAVNGAGSLILSAGGTISLGGSVGATTPLNSFNLLQGRLNLGANNLNAGNVTVGDFGRPIEATLGMTGAVNGNINVQATGNLAPGGLGTVGTMTVVGSVNLDGDLAVDFSPAGADQLAVTGFVNIGGASRLGGGLGTGRLSASTATLIDSGGGVSGQFQNAAVGVPVLAGTDVITVVAYNPDVVVVPYSPPSGFGPTASGIDPIDATGFKATLTGGGTLVTGTDWEGKQFLVARDTTAASKLTITTTANGSDDLMTFTAGVLVSGPLAAFSAPRVNIGDQFRVSGAVTAASFRDLLGLTGEATLDFGGTAAQLTTITARNLTGSVRTGSTLTSLKVAQTLGAQVGLPGVADSVVVAPAVGTVTAAGATVNFETPGRLNSLKVTRDYFGSVTADSVGTVSAGSITGDVRAAKAVTAVKTTGAFEGTIAADSLGVFSVAGGEAVLDVTKGIGSITGVGANPLTLAVSAASVGPVKVGGQLLGDSDPATLDWDVTNGIASLAAGAVSGTDVSAKFLGTTAVKGNLTAGLAGHVDSSTFTLTGDDGSTGKFGLKSLTVQGNVTDSRFDVKTGNVGAVTVARFHDSQFWVGYTPSASGDFLQGAVANGGKLASFKTTAVALAAPHPLQWAFRGSQVVSGSIGTVTLSGLQTANGGTAFGIKVRGGGAVVKVANADVTPAALPRNTPLAADNNAPYAPLAGDFFFVDV